MLPNFNIPELYGLEKWYLWLQLWRHAGQIWAGVDHPFRMRVASKALVRQAAASDFSLSSGLRIPVRLVLRHYHSRLLQTFTFFLALSGPATLKHRDGVVGSPIKCRWVVILQRTRYFVPLRASRSQICGAGAIAQLRCHSVFPAPLIESGNCTANQWRTPRCTKALANPSTSIGLVSHTNFMYGVNTVSGSASPN